MHISFQGKEGKATDRVKAVWLFIIAITLHNMPEGLAVGVGFGSGELNDAFTLMIAIGLQNIPEGLAVSICSMNAGLGQEVLREHGRNPGRSG
ncbi:MAG: ZIP family metal transporter [Desulfobacterales bacterium]|nr:ZIP family metal transporter [Desulfobacterales bacterium]